MTSVTFSLDEKRNISKLKKLSSEQRYSTIIPQDARPRPKKNGGSDPKNRQLLVCSLETQCIVVSINEPCSVDSCVTKSIQNNFTSIQVK